MKEFTSKEAREYTKSRGKNTKFWINRKDFLKPHYLTLKKTEHTIKSSLLSKNTCIIKFHNN